MKLDLPKEFDKIASFLNFALEHLETNKYECNGMLRKTKTYDQFMDKYSEDKRMMFELQFNLTKMLLDAFHQWNFLSESDDPDRKKVFIDAYYSDFVNKAQKMFDNF